MGSIFWLDLRETLRARWFQIFIGGFASLLAIFFALGIAESQILGFTGLGRTLLTFIQISLVILPGFVLIATSRSLVADRESGVLEYLLAMPVSLNGYFWGKFAARALAFAGPLVFFLWAAALWNMGRGGTVPVGAVLYFVALIVSLVVFFLAVAMAISFFARSQEMAVGLSFVVWLLAEALIDSLLLGALVRGAMPPEMVMSLSLLNPIQTFRVAAFSLFDPELTALGPLALTVAEDMGITRLRVWALVWPAASAIFVTLLTCRFFFRRDVV